jgi:ribose transport system substrate-binding protein
MLRKLLVVAVFFMVLIGGTWARGGQASDGKIKAIFVAMDQMDEHWLKVKAGAEAKAQELGNVDLSFNAPSGKTDPAAQLQIVEDAISKKVDILMLAPLDMNALAPGVEKAYDAGIKVIIIDSPINTDKWHSFFSTDNGAAARLAADEMAKLIDNKGKIAIISVTAGTGTVMIRVNDFTDQIAKKYPGITVVGTQYSDGDKTRALNIATDFMTANPDLAGIYATNEGTTVGGGAGIEQAGKAGIIKFVGFDWSADTKALVERGVLNASMVQNPYEMGYQGLQAGVDLMQGKTVPKQVDTGVTVAAKNNVNSIK